LRSESQSDFEKRMNRRVFYRLEAKYTHEDRNTGEIEEINFDIVALCDSVLMDPKGLTAPREAPVPGRFGKATKDGGLALLQVPKACSDSVNMVRDKIPDDLTPFVIWWDSIHEMGPGLGFATEDAYESPISPLKFHGAKITNSSFEEWQAWREKQLAEFEPVSFLQSPWGVTANGNHPEIVSKEYGWFRACRGAQRIALPQEVQERVKKLWPDGAPDYWIYSDAGVDRQAIRDLLKSDEYQGGLFMGRLYTTLSGIITRRGGGVFLGGTLILADIQVNTILVSMRVPLIGMVVILIGTGKRENIPDHLLGILTSARR